MVGASMAIFSAAGCLAVVLTIVLVAMAFGNRTLQIAGLNSSNSINNLLFSAGVAFAILQVLLEILGLLSGLTRIKVILLLLLLAISAGRGWKTLPHSARHSRKELRGMLSSTTCELLAVCIGFFLALEAFVSTAPLSGSDAMHYHFTVPLLQLGNPEHPLFWLTHSFLTGLAHEFIAMGLALGSGRISLLLIFLGGAGTAIALLSLAASWMPSEWALASTLVFLATPMVFWQITTAGAPDIWMAFYALLAVLAVDQFRHSANRRWLILASVFAGAAAGVKYTGWIVPIVIVCCIFFVHYSPRFSSVCALAALASGGIPQLRNFIWTGDPFFPFLERWIGRVPVNSYALRMLTADTHAHAFSLNPLNLLRLPFAMILHGSQYGLGQYFGPVVLAFLPLLYFCKWRSTTVWVAGALCASMFIGNAFTTQMARFLLPAYPLALALVFAGTAEVVSKRPGLLRFECISTLLIFTLFATAADARYSRDFLPVALGITNRDTFLDRMAPDYRTAEFVNAALEHRGGRALVFFRHLYYLRVPYMNGDPASSWAVDPNQLSDARMVLKFLHEQGIRWVVKTQDYPTAVAAAFEECEKEGHLIPETGTQVYNLSGTSRTLDLRIKVQVVVLRVKDETVGNE